MVTARALLEAVLRSPRTIRCLDGGGNDPQLLLDLLLHGSDRLLRPAHIAPCQVLLGASERCARLRKLLGDSVEIKLDACDIPRF